MKLIEKIQKDDIFVNCEEAIDKMIHHLNLIKGDLTEECNNEDTNKRSLNIRMHGFNSLNEVFQKHISKLELEKVV